MQLSESYMDVTRGKTGFLRFFGIKSPVSLNVIWTDKGQNWILSFLKMPKPGVGIVIV